MKYHNPIIRAEQQANKIVADHQMEDSPELDEKLGRIFSAAWLSQSEDSRRLARITLKAAREKEQSYDASEGKYKLDEIQAAAQFTSDPFEARLIGLALHGWWNDTIDAAWCALGIEPERDQHGNFTAEFWENTITGFELPAPTPIIERFPGIKAVALEIAYDNGMINREQSQEDWLARLDEVLGAEGVYEVDLQEINAFCLTLSKEEQETLAAGEQSEMEAIQQRFAKPELLGIFNDIFEH